MTEPAEESLFMNLPAAGGPELVKLFPSPDYFIAYADGAAIQDKAALMEALSAAFRFPAYFGRNWDALLDCLRSLPNEIPAKGYILAVKDSKIFLSAAPADMAAFAATAAEAKKFLAEKAKADFRIVLL